MKFACTTLSTDLVKDYKLNHPVSVFLHTVRQCNHWSPNLHLRLANVGESAWVPVKRLCALPLQHRFHWRNTMVPTATRIACWQLSNITDYGSTSAVVHVSVVDGLGKHCGPCLFSHLDLVPGRRFMLASITHAETCPCGQALACCGRRAERDPTLRLVF